MGVSDIDDESAWSVVFAETKSTATEPEHSPSDKEDDEEEDDDDDDDWLMGSLRYGPLLRSSVTV